MRPVALIWSGFTEFSSQICSQAIANILPPWCGNALLVVPNRQQSPSRPATDHDMERLVVPDPILPGSGEACDRGEHDPRRAVVGVVGRAAVVVVVVTYVVKLDVADRNLAPRLRDGSNHLASDGADVFAERVISRSSSADLSGNRPHLWGSRVGCYARLIRQRFSRLIGLRGLSGGSTESDRSLPVACYDGALCCGGDVEGAPK